MTIIETTPSVHFTIAQRYCAPSVYAEDAKWRITKTALGDYWLQYKQNHKSDTWRDVVRMEPTAKLRVHGRETKNTNLEDYARGMAN